MMKTLDTQRQKHLLLDNLSLVYVMVTRLDLHIYVYVYAYTCFLSAILLFRCVSSWRPDHFYSAFCVIFALI